MAGNSFALVPPDLNDKEALKRFLTSLMEKVDQAYGNRGEGEAFTSNPKQEAIEDLKIDDENLKDIESKINQILLALRKSNIISG